MAKLPEGFVLEDEPSIQGLPSGFVLEDSSDPMKDMGTIEKGLKTVQYGAANTVAGVGATLRRLGAKETGAGTEQNAQSLAPKDYRPASADFFDPKPEDRGLLGYGWGYAPRAIGEALPGLAVDLGAGKAGAMGGGFVGGPVGAAIGGFGGFIGSNLLRNFGPNLDQRMQNQAPGAEASGTDYAAAGASTAASALLQRLGLIPAVGYVTKGAGGQAIAQIPGQVAKAAGAEGVAGGAGNVIEQVGRTAGTEKGLSVDPKEAFGSAVLDAGAGGAVRAARTPADVTFAVRARDMDEASAGRVANRFNEIDTQANSPKNTYEAIQEVSRRIDTELSDAASIVRPLLKSTGDDTETDATRVLVKDTLAAVKQGHTIRDVDLEDITSRIGSSQEGARLVDLIKDRNTLNRLVKMGRKVNPGESEPEGYFAGGLSSTPFFENVLNPAAMAKGRIGSFITHLGPSAAGVAGVSVPAALGATGGAAAGMLAAPAGAYAGARLLDNITGMRNPVEQFVQRFSTSDPAQAGNPDAPSFRAQAEADKLAQAQASQEARTEKQNVKNDQRVLSRAENDIKKAAKANALAFRDNSEAIQKAILDGQKQGEKQQAQKEAYFLRASQQARKAQEALAKIEAQKDAAWRSKEVDESTKAAQEEAMWRSVQERPQEDGWSDEQAQAGIQRTIKERESESKTVVERAKKAAEARKKLEEAERKLAEAKEADFDKARKQAERQRAEEQKAQAEQDALWRSRELDPNSKTAQEEAMWRQLEQEAPRDFNEDQAASAIKSELKNRESTYADIVKRAKAAADARRKAEEQAQKNAPNKEADFERARKEAERQRMAEASKQEQMDALWRSRDLDPDARRAQEEAMWRQLEGPTAPREDIDPLQAEKAIKSEYDRRESESKSVVSQSKKAAEALRKLKEAEEKKSKGDTAPKPEKPASEAPRASKAEPKAETSQPPIRIEVDGYVVEVDRSKPRNVPAYVQKTRGRMKTRADFGKALSEVVGNKHKAIVDEIVNKLNQTVRSGEDAYYAVEDAINRLPDKYWGQAWDVFNAHEAKIRSTYGD